MVSLFENIKQIERSIKTDIDRIRKQNGTQQKAWQNVFEEFDRQLGAIFAYAHHTLIGSFDEKVKHMDSFTICLFGKTKAGKSTTMEALTCGTGTTIGKGRQNTTLVAEEYHWNGLTVVDTPGIDSMQERKELETTALEFADGSDLILFLMPHQIEEADFIQFARFYKQNKPIVILLNLKAATGKPGTAAFDDFVQHADHEVFDQDAIQGYRSRINGFILRSLGIPEGLVPIIPVHSLSAFLARSSAPSLSEPLCKRLYDISRFTALEQRLIEEVKSYGELYRIRNPYDTLILFSRETGDHFRAFSNLMQKQKMAFESNVTHFSEVAADVRRQYRQIIQKSFVRYFAGKRSAARGVVDELFDAGADKTKHDRILQDFMPEQQVQQKVDEAQAEIRSCIEKEITDYFQSFQRQLEAIAIEAQKAQVGHMAGADMAAASKIGQTADLMRGLGVASGVVSGIVFTVAATSLLGPVGTIFWIGTPNVWNPVGWALMALGIGLSIFGWAKAKERRKKLQRAKKDAADKLVQAIDETERSITDGLEKSVEDAIKSIQTDHIDVMALYAQYAGKHLNEVAALTEFLDRLRSQTQQTKYQSMIRRFEGNDKLIVTEVVEGQDGVSITLSHDIKKAQELEKALSRIEERPIVFTRRPACFN
jgi:hypothetical protein